MRSVENAEVENARSVENVECRKCGVNLIAECENAEDLTIITTITSTPVPLKCNAS